MGVDEILPRPQGASVLQKETVRIRSAFSGRWGGDVLSLITGARDTVLFDQTDIRVGTQSVHVIGGELSGITADEVESMGDTALGGRDAALDGGNMGIKGHPSLEENDVSARGGVGDARDTDGVRHEEEVLWCWESLDAPQSLL